MKSKSIQTQIITVILSIVILLGIVLGTGSCILNYSTASAVLEQSMTELAEVAAEQIAGEIRNMQNVAVQAGLDMRLSDVSTSKEAKKQAVEDYALNFGFTRGNLLDISGTSYFDGNNYAERDYFQASIKGQPFISNPTVSKITGQISFLVSAPVWQDGKKDTTVVGVVYFVPDVDFLNKIVEALQPSDNGYGYLINKNGTSVADIDRSLVATENSIEESKTDSSLRSLAAIEQRMIQGEIGFGSHIYNGKKWVQGFAPVKNTDGWSLGIMAPERDFLNNFYLSIIITVILTLLFIVVGIIVSYTYARRLTGPLKECVKRLKLLAEGDLHTSVKEADRMDEIGVLQQSTSILVKELNAVVMDIAKLLTEIAERNLDVTAKNSYEGDFLPIKQSVTRIVDALNEAMGQIQESAVFVEVSAGQMSDGSQALSEGASEQASAIEELLATVENVKNDMENSAENAQETALVMNEIGAKAEASSSQMTLLIETMDNMSKSSKEIAAIINTIEEIAEQTNMLSLNASIEAARAGEAGRGFAVVAGEIGKLAAQSGTAVQETRELIEKTLSGIDNGTAVSKNTASSLYKMKDAITGAIDMAEESKKTALTQSAMMKEINGGIEQISVVIQTNSATAQESAATSEELSSQAQLLKNLTAQFKLRKK